MSDPSSVDPSRRRFVLRALAGAGSAAFLALGARSVRAQAAGQQAGAAQRLSPSDPTAKSLGYTENAANVDRGRFPMYMPGQACAKCRFYMGKAGAEWGPCQFFMNKEVNSKGWCAAFVQKT